jgi:hypothetical protein
MSKGNLQTRKTKNGKKNQGREDGGREKKGREKTRRQGTGQRPGDRQTHHENVADNWLF